MLSFAQFLQMQQMFMPKGPTFPRQHLNPDIVFRNATPNAAQRERMSFTDDNTGENWDFQWTYAVPNRR